MAIMPVKSFLWFLCGILVAVWVGYPMAQRQAAWEHRTLACVPNYVP